MRRLREITVAEENFRVEQKPGLGTSFIRRDPVEPEPIGTCIAKAFRIVGYDRDCDGSLMARLAAIDSDGQTTGWKADCIGLYPNTAVVLDSPGELFKLCDGSNYPTQEGAR